MEKEVQRELEDFDKRLKQNEEKVKNAEPFGKLKVFVPRAVKNQSLTSQTVYKLSVKYGITPWRAAIATILVLLLVFAYAIIAQALSK